MTSKNTEAVPAHADGELISALEALKAQPLVTLLLMAPSLLEQLLAARQSLPQEIERLDIRIGECGTTLDELEDTISERESRLAMVNEAIRASRTVLTDAARGVA